MSKYIRVGHALTEADELDLSRVAAHCMQGAEMYLKITCNITCQLTQGAECQRYDYDDKGEAKMCLIWVSEMVCDWKTQR